MSFRISDGVFVAPKCKAYFDAAMFNFFPNEWAILEAHSYAGEAIGSAVISAPAHYAQDADPDLGRTVRLKFDGQWIFRGLVIEGDFQIGPDEDQLVLTCVDDKWRLQHRTIGQMGIGTQGSPTGADGFADVGFDTTFNKDGKPNKNPGSLDFSLGSTAVYWTLEDILEWIFQYYVELTWATLDTDDLSAAYEREPSHLALGGQTVLQAIDTVAQLAGQSWGLRAGANYSTFVPVAPGSGSVRAVRLAKPRMRGRANDATIYHASSCRISKTIRNAFDTYQAVSAPIVKETTYTTSGVDPLLVLRAGWSDGDWVTRYDVDVEAYAAHELGADRTAGAAPKPWLPHLLTRRKSDSQAYITAAEIAATPALRHAEQIGEPIVWLATDGVAANARRVTGGMRIDLDHGTVDFKAEVELLDDTEDASAKEEISDWATVDIWLTVATVLETPESVETSAGNQYLHEPAYFIIAKSDLVPERRQDVWLPDLAAGNNDVTTASAGSEEEYVSVTDQLQDAIDSAIASTPAVETQMDADMPFAPVYRIGERIEVLGRESNATGDEVVVESSFQIYEKFESRIRATNVVGAEALDPEQFVEPV